MTLAISGGTGFVGKRVLAMAPACRALTRARRATARTGYPVTFRTGQRWRSCVRGQMRSFILQAW